MTSMNGEVKVYLVLAFWSLLIYFLGVRHYSLFYQRIFNGRPIRSAIKMISLNSFKSFFSGTFISFLMQSPFGATNHIKSYVQSGLVNFKQMGVFVSGSKWGSSLSLLLLLVLPSVPKKVIIATLLLSLFFKIFLPKIRFWFINLLLLVSVMILSINELNFASAFIATKFGAMLTPMILAILAIWLAVVFKSSLFSGLIFFLLLAQSVTIDQFFIYIMATHIGLAIYFLVSSLKYNRTVKKVLTIKLLSSLLSGVLLAKFHVQILALVEQGLTKIVSATTFANALEGGGAVFEGFNQWANINFNHSAANIIYFVSLNLFFVLSFTVINTLIILLVNKFFNKSNESKPKQMQSLIFPSNIQFYSPYLYVDHFKQESKKMAAMLENIINIALDENSHTDSEALLRAKKYNLILERVRAETREYSVKSLKKIRISYARKENLQLLQVTEVIEEISRHSLNLLNVKGKEPFNKQEAAYAQQITNNYDHIFESFMSNSISIYPSKLASIKNESVVSKALDEINVSVLELATLLKNINKLRLKSKS